MFALARGLAFSYLLLRRREKELEIFPSSLFFLFPFLFYYSFDRSSATREISF